jgi:DNA-binding CsgD family transcriptional regulator
VREAQHQVVERAVRQRLGALGQPALERQPDPPVGPQGGAAGRLGLRLSERGQDVTRLVLQGESTAAISERLVVAPHTVQQHLKSILEKTGVHSRRYLVG